MSCGHEKGVLVRVRIEEKSANESEVYRIFQNSQPSLTPNPRILVLVLVQLFFKCNLLVEEVFFGSHHLAEFP